LKVLLIGSGGREHSLGWALSGSPLLTKLYAAPGNPGLAEVAECVALDTADHAAVIRFCREHAIEFAVVGPEAPLVAGLADDLEAAAIKTFGPSKAAAQLEGSKSFTKALCAKHGIPTGAYQHFTHADPAKAYVRNQPLPIVIKADGLAAGKGVIIAQTVAEAEAAIDACFGGAFGAAGSEIIVEEFLDGEEASFFALIDGETVVPLSTAQDHKRAFDGDLGPNTGGMGAYSPAFAVTPALTERIMSEIVHPTATAMCKAGTPFRGVLFVGLMLTADGPKLVEFNVRFGDPECEALMVRLQSDLLTVLTALRNGRARQADIQWSDDVSISVVMAALGYPGAYKGGTEIRGLEEAGTVPGVRIFHAGTALAGGKLVAKGGRVLNVTAKGATIAEARERAYLAISKIDWPGGFCRTDIGWRALEPNGG
jgi:phosphoribosylamine--glycine ligase